MSRGDRVEIAVDIGTGVQTYEIEATRAGRRVEVSTGRGVTEVSEVVHRLLHSLVTNAPPKNREAEAAKARARASKRYGAPAPTAEPPRE